MPQTTVEPAGSLKIWTYDWVPEMPRGHVRDVRLRWALEEAGLPYTVEATSFDNRGADHLARQPFAQVPFLQDGEVTLFESGACLLHLAEKSETLLPRDPQGRADTLQWLMAALNSVEMATVPWWFLNMSGAAENPLHSWMMQRFDRLETVLAGRDWLAAQRFTVADLIMAEVLRIPQKLGKLQGHPALDSYVTRICARPAFVKARDEQIAFFQAADGLRKAEGG